MALTEPILQWTFDKAYEYNFTNVQLSANLSESLDSQYFTPVMKNTVSTMMGMGDFVIIIVIAMAVIMTVRITGLPSIHLPKKNKHVKTVSIPFYKLILIKLGLAQIKER